MIQQTQPMPPQTVRIILGCGTFGGIGGARRLIGKGLDATAAAATMDEAAALGIDLWDTAERYAGGASEELIGAWLCNRPPVLTERIRIATKVAPASLAGDRETPFDEKYIEARLEASLSRLRRHRVALFLAHAPCEVTPIEMVVEAFAAVLESGRAERVGCCNIGPEGLAAALDAAERLGVRGFDWVQNSFSLLSPGADRELRAICRERHVAYSPYSPLAGGILAGRYRRGEPFPPDSRMALRPDGQTLSGQTHDALDVLRSVAGGMGASCAAVGLAWILGHPDCTSPVVGPSRSAPHLAHISEALAVDLSDGDRARLERAFAAVPTDD
jgi:aryl-alcohol dehydrogenase-like predicted oxidoreductase